MVMMMESMIEILMVVMLESMSMIMWVTMLVIRMVMMMLQLIYVRLCRFFPSISMPVSMINVGSLLLLNILICLNLCVSYFKTETRLCVVSRNDSVALKNRI